MSRTWLEHFILVILHVEYAFHDVFKVLKVDSKEMSMTFDASYVSTILHNNCTMTIEPALAFESHSLAIA